MLSVQVSCLSTRYQSTFPASRHVVSPRFLSLDISVYVSCLIHSLSLDTLSVHVACLIHSLSLDMLSVHVSCLSTRCQSTFPAPRHVVSPRCLPLDTLSVHVSCLIHSLSFDMLSVHVSCLIHSLSLDMSVHVSCLSTCCQSTFPASRHVVSPRCIIRAFVMCTKEMHKTQ
jgi:hypothetical protein